MRQRWDADWGVSKLSWAIPVAVQIYFGGRYSGFRVYVTIQILCGYLNLSFGSRG